MKINLLREVLIPILLFQFLGVFAQKNEQKINQLFSGYTTQTPGVAIVVMKKGEIIFKKGYGAANLEYDVPITSQTIFHCASVSKQFTAFAIYLLEQQGQLSLDDNIRKYIPEVPKFKKPILIKHLLYHTSGLKEYFALMTFAGWRMDDVFTTRQILKIVHRQKTLNFTPGSKFSYTNTGYALLAEVIARVSGKSFAAFTKQYIFEPLGMRNTQFYNDHERIVKNRAYAYFEKNKRYKKDKLNFSLVGSTGLFSTVEDLSKWANNFKHPVVGNSALIQRFNQPAALNDGKPALLTIGVKHAKGQFLRNYRGVDSYLHTGGDASFRSFLGRFPSQDLTVILLSNAHSFKAFPMGMKVAEFYLKNHMTKKRLETNTIRQPTKRKNKSFSSDLSRFNGKFSSKALATSYTLNLQGNRLRMVHPRLPDIVLTQTSHTTFSGINSFHFQLKFITDKRKKVVGFMVTDFRGETIRFDKM